MHTIQKLQTELQEKWDTLRQQHWKCTAQKRCGLLWFAPMLDQIESLDSAADELQELCRESEQIANSVREPDENDQQGESYIWQID